MSKVRKSAKTLVPRYQVTGYEGMGYEGMGKRVTGGWGQGLRAMGDELEGWMVGRLEDWKAVAAISQSRLRIANLPAFQSSTCRTSPVSALQRFLAAGEAKTAETLRLDSFLIGA